MFICESWLDSDKYAKLKSKLKRYGYSVEHSPRNNRIGGGLAIIFNQNLKVVPKKSSASYDSFESFEVSIVSRHTADTISLIYRPQRYQNGKTTIHDFLEDIVEFVSNCNNSRGRYLLLGDFNIHVDIPTDSDTKKFFDILNQFDLRQHVDFPTHIEGHTLDLIVTRSNETCVTNFAPSVFISDHCAVLFNYHISSKVNLKYPSKTISYRRLKNIDEDNIETHISSKFTEAFYDISDSNLCCNIYNDILSSGLDAIAPTKHKTISERPSLPWINKDILDEKILRRKAEDKWRRSRSDEDRKSYRQHCNVVKKKTSKGVNTHLKEQIDKCNGNQRKLFNVINDILERKPQYLPDCDSKLDLAEDFSHSFYYKIKAICDLLPPVDISFDDGLTRDFNCNLSCFTQCTSDFAPLRVFRY